jgi:aminoglycoside phosphotransferase (APT) family kinase protein
VQRLLARDVPRYAGLPLRRVPTWGTDHVVFRLGAELAVRLPKIDWAAAQGERERRWLPVLAPHLPVRVPVPLVIGAPGFGYPFPWYVVPWLPGHTAAATATTAGGLATLAEDVAAFVLALQAAPLDPEAPPAEPGVRGGPLAAADDSTRAAAAELGDDPDVPALLAAWDAGLAAPAWSGPRRWVHGDLLEGNLLMHAGHLAGVIDWGGLRAADPAVDLMLAWTLLDAPSRAAYRERLGFVDDATWCRGRAWAASAALHALPYYRDTNPDIVARSRRTARAIAAEQGV